MASRVLGSAAGGCVLAAALVGCGGGNEIREPRWHEIGLGADVTVRFDTSCDDSVLTGCARAPVASIQASTFDRSSGRGRSPEALVAT